FIMRSLTQWEPLDRGVFRGADQIFTAVTRIQYASSPDGGSAPRDDLYSPECQQRPGQQDEPQRQIPSEDLSSAQCDFAAAWNRTAGFVWLEENWPSESGFSQGFFSPSLLLSPLACLIGDT
uniref:Uncharacterized protein n=1 Tax=Cyprinus carpio TaxID=7962 RepID=A0A8C1PNT9_CYPCA